MTYPKTIKPQSEAPASAGASGLLHTRGRLVSVRFTSIYKSFSSSFPRKKVDAVVDLNLTIESGEIFGIIGPNGAGKSTLLKMLMGFIRPSAGEISVFGQSPSNPKIKHKIGYLPENPYYYDHLSAEELMQFSARTSGMQREEIGPRIDQLLQVMSLDHARKRKLRSYSKGMTQRAGICFALVHDPELVIFDEPMSGLDPIGRKDVVNLVLDLKRKGKTVLFCSHILNDVEKLCDRMAIMNKGRLLRVMTREELKNSSQEVVINCGICPGLLSEDLFSLGATVDNVDGKYRISCSKTSINSILKKMKEHDVDISDIQSSDDALETLFLKTIKSET